MKLLNIKDLYTIAEDDNNKKILNGLNLEINEGEIHVIMGPNGSGKSTLANTCFNSPRYIVTKGSIELDNEDITNKSTDYIAKKGLFMSFQTPEEIPGITVANFLKSTKKSVTGENPKMFEFYKEVNEIMKNLNMNPDYINREFNVGFSGGEKKKAEILQLLMLKPNLAILDETDSGLDVDAVKTVSEGIKAYKEKVGGALIIITHSTRILESLDVDYTHILVDGKIVKSGDTTLVDEINREGFEKYITK